MAITIGTVEPSCFTIGDTVSWTRTEADYPAPTWHLVYGFSGPIRFQIGSVQSGVTTSHQATMPSTGIQPGDYIWTVKATDDTSTISIGKGVMRALPNLTTIDAELDAAEQRLATLEAALTTLTSGNYTSVSVDGVAYTRAQYADVKSNLMFARREVARLKAQRDILLGHAAGNLHLTHFLIR